MRWRRVVTEWGAMEQQDIRDLEGAGHYAGGLA